MFHPLAEWLSSDRGRAVWQTERALLGEALEDCFGWELVQVGGWGDGRGLLQAARTRSQALVSANPCEGADVIGRLTQLPIAGDSVDAVILPHTLEFETDPYAVLREADRVLAGEGKLLILGFAPSSPWGLRANASRAGFPPGLRRVMSARRLLDWTKLLGYDVLEVRHYLYELPWGRPVEGSRRVRRGWFYPWPAGAYLLKARKRLHALTPLRPKLLERRRQTVLGGLAEPSSASRAPRRIGE